jgi:acetate CoA/acetoacetate CoA-transferase alpha subunit
MEAVSVEEAVAMIPNGATIMVGGFMGVGTPERLLDELVRQKKSELAIIANDAAVPGSGIGKLFDASLVSAITASHIGLNPKVQEQMMAKKIAVTLVPQGTLVERIRCGGCGLGGVLTPTGAGTIVEEGKQRIEINGKHFHWKQRCDRNSRWCMPSSQTISATSLTPSLRETSIRLWPWRPTPSLSPRSTSFRSG